MKIKREKFGGRMAVIAAFAGSAIGLGNIWRFPYLVGENGGAAFILLYIGFTLFLSLPIFLAESAIGRSQQVNCRAAVSFLVPGRAGKWFGFLLVLTPLWVVSYYSVVGGWSLDYLIRAASLDFVRSTPEQLSGSFERFISHPWVPVLFHLAFLGATAAVVAFGALKTRVETSRLQRSNRKMERAQASSMSRQTTNDIRERQLHFKPEIDVRGMRGDEALQAITYFMDDAIQFEAKRVRILHGTGTGALRQLLRQYLLSLSGVRTAHDEDVRLGGAGITVVELE